MRGNLTEIITSHQAFNRQVKLRSSRLPESGHINFAQRKIQNPVVIQRSSSINHVGNGRFQVHGRAGIIEDHRIIRQIQITRIVPIGGSFIDQAALIQDERCGPIEI